MGPLRLGSCSVRGYVTVNALDAAQRMQYVSVATCMAWTCGRGKVQPERSEDMQRILHLVRNAVALLVMVGLWAGSPTEVQAQYFAFGKNKVHYQAHDWFFVQSQHFDVYYYDEDGRYLAEFTARAAEDAYEQIAIDFQHQISERISLLVYKSHNDFAVTNAVQLPEYSEGIGGVTELFKNRIAIPFTGDYRDYRRVVHHELVHAIINDMFYGGSIQSIIQNNIQLNIPLWFNEGMAEYSAQGWDTQSDMYLRDAIVSDYLAPIPYLSGFFAYRGGQGVWDYVSEQYGREKIGEIFQRLRLTRSVESSFRRAIGLSLEELSERWHSTLKKVHWPEVTARQDLDEIAKAIITREKGGFYNTSPAISPQGDKVAYISTKDGLFDVFVASANDGRRIRKLIDGQDNTQFESLKILTPGLTWNPEGTKIALAVKSGATDAIAVVDVDTKESTHYRIPGLDAIMTVSWSPLGDKIAFSASMNAQSDIYVLDLESEETTNHTNDLFSDHEPAWAPDGQSLVFYSDRGDYIRLGRHTESNFNMLEHDYSQYDVYSLPLEGATVERLTYNELWDDQSPKYGEDANQLLFISDRNGIPNLYEKDLTTGIERPLTNLLIGVTQISLSADGNKAALVSLKEGTPSIYMLKTPFNRSFESESLQPNVWAQRVMQDKVESAPAIALASEETLQRNPILRDASDGVPFSRRLPRQRDAILASRTGLPGLDPSSTDATLGGDEPAEQVDSTATRPGTIDFKNYVFSSAFEEAQDDDQPAEVLNPFEPQDNQTEDGRLKQKKYKLSFSPDIIYGTTAYDPLYGGVQGVTQMAFSDVLGNHQIYAATNLLIDLRNSDYLLAYSFLPKRIDYTLSAFHSARVLPQYSLNTFVRYRYFGGGFSASYPLDKFRRVDANISVLSVSQTDVGNPANPTQSRSFLYPSLTYTTDVTVPGFLTPSSGHRFGVTLSGSPAGSLQFGTLLGDYRWYASLGRFYSFAVRGSAGMSFGRNQQLFYTSGVSNWINRDFDDFNGFPITDVADFIFATPVLPLRGADINSQNGSNFGLINAEFRFPLFAAILPGPIPIIPLYNLQGTAFVDAGSVWGGRSTNEEFNFWTRNENGERIFDDPIVGAGFGLRTIMLGFPVRIDWAWPHDGQGFGKRRVYFSFGIDF